MRYLIIILLIAFSAPISAQDEENTSPVIAIRIPVGETVTIKGYEIKFDAVVEDSRCPTNVECIWAGRAKVSLIISGDAEVEWIFGETLPGEISDKYIQFSDELLIEGLQLTPYPDEPGQEMDYVLLVRTLETQ